MSETGLPWATFCSSKSSLVFSELCYSHCFESQSDDHFICLFLYRVDTTDTNEDAPIHASLLYHNFENTKLLLEYNANLELKNNKGRKPIHNANDTESLELLLDHGADIDARDGNGKMIIFNQQDFVYAYISTSVRTELADSMVTGGTQEWLDTYVLEKGYFELLNTSSSSKYSCLDKQ